MTETLMTEQAATTTEGAAASQATDTAQQTSAAPEQVAQQQPAAEQEKPAAQDAQKAEQEAGDKVEDAQKAPETYEFKAPEGKAFDAEIIAEYSDVAKELNLSQENAQKLLDRLAPKLAERQTQQLEAVRTEWAEAATADKEFGGERLKENLAIAKTALDKFGTPELRTLLNQSGLGNNPEVIRFMFRAGKAIGGDRYVGSSVGAGQKAGGPRDFSDQAAALYGNQQ